MIESLQRYSSVQSSLIVVDNSDQRLRVNELNVYQFLMKNNVGHGEGLNFGIKKSIEMFPKNKFVMFLDVDCHILKNNWEEQFIKQMETFDVIGGKGPPSKPIRPACMFMKKSIAESYDWSPTDGYKGNRITPGGYDVAIKAYYKIMLDNLKIGFLEKNKNNRYQTHNGEEWCVNNIPFIYHHWHGSSLHIRQEEFPDVDLQQDKNKLFTNIPWRLP